MYLIFNYLLQNLGIFSFGLTLSFTLVPKYSRAKSLAVYQFIYAILFIIKMANFSNATFLLILSVTAQALSFLYALIAFTDTVFNKILTTTCLILLSCFSEYIALFFLPKILPNLGTITADNKMVFVYGSSALCVQIVLSLFFMFFWRYFTQKKTPLLLLKLSLLPMFQLVTYVFLLNPFFFRNDVTRPFYIATCMLIALVSNFVLLYYLLKKHEKKTIEDEYADLQNLYTIDLKYYQDIELQHEALAKIRHDYQNQLATLYMLISSNEIESAQQLITSINNEIKHTL